MRLSRTSIPARAKTRVITACLRERVFNRFGFVAPLKTGVLLERGAGAMSYTGGTGTRTVTDFEGNVRNALAGEVRFQSGRRIRNMIVGSSEDLTNASWTKTNCGAAYGILDPFGGAKASRLTTTSGGVLTRAIQSITNPLNNYVVISMWLRADVPFTTFIAIGDTQARGINVDVTSTWQRFVIPVQQMIGSANANPLIYLNKDGDAGGAFAVANRTLDVYGVMLEDVSRQAVMQLSEYVSVGAAKLNELIYTEELDNAAWTKTATTITTNAAAAPNGALSADRMSDTVANSTHEISSVFNKAATAKNYTLGIYAKYENTATLYIEGQEGANGARASFDIQARTANTIAAYGVGFTSLGSSITDVGNGWVLCLLTLTSNTGATLTAHYRMGSSSAYVGGSGTMLLWGAMAYEGTTALPYWPVGNVYQYPQLNRTSACCVDGVAYSDVTNPNTVTANVVSATAPTLPVEGYAAAFVPGTAGNYFRMDDAPANRISGDIAIVFGGALDNWANGANQGLCRKWYTAAAALARSFELRLTATGVLQLSTSVDGTAITTGTSSVAVGFANGTFHYVAAYRVAATGLVRFYTSDDGVNWTQLGTDQSTTAGGIKSDGGGTFDIGLTGLGGDNYMAGRAMRCKLFNTISFQTATPVVDFNPRDGWTENRFAYSSDQTQSNWTAASYALKAFGAGSVSNAVAAPDGTVTADLLVPDTTNAAHGIGQFNATPIADGAHYVSICAKAAGYNIVTIGANSSSAIVQVDLSTGAATVTAGLSGGAIPLGGGWYRVWCVATFSNGMPFINIMQAINTFAFAADGSSGIYVWGAQSRRLFAFGAPSLDAYVPTPAGARRGWYSTTTGEFWDMNGMASLRKNLRPRAWTEEAGTNLVLQSSNFANASWTKTASLTVTSAAAYCGDIALDLLNDTNAAGAESAFQAVTFTGNAVKSISCLIKQGTSTKSVFQLWDFTGAVTKATAEITWVNGVPAITMVTAGTQERPPEPMGNGVWRVFIASAAVTAANVHRVYVYPASDSSGTAAPTGTLYVGGVEARDVPYATNHIPTTTGTASRGADSLQVPIAGNFGTATGTVYAEISAFGNFNAAGAIHLGVNGADAVDYINSIASISSYDGTTAPTLNTTSMFGRTAKTAVRFSGSTRSLSVDGLLGTSAFDGSVNGGATLYVGGTAGRELNGGIGPVMSALTGVSNAEITTITR